MNSDFPTSNYNQTNMYVTIFFKIANFRYALLFISQLRYLTLRQSNQIIINLSQ